jgi:hypothetical protein
MADLFLKIIEESDEESILLCLLVEVKMKAENMESIP